MALSPEEQIKLNKLIEEGIKLSRQLNDTQQESSFENYTGSLVDAERLVASLRKEWREYTSDIAGTREGFTRIVDEIKKMSTGTNAARAAFKSLASLAQKLQYHQEGISKLSSKEIDNLKKQVDKRTADLNLAEKLAKDQIDFLKNKGRLNTKEKTQLKEAQAEIEEIEGSHNYVEKSINKITSDMLFYGKEIDFTIIILIVIVILAAYILFSYYQQQKQSIPIIFDSHSTITSTTVAIPAKTQLKNGAFAISLWIKFNSSIPSSVPSFNLLRLTKTNGTATPLSLTLDASGNLIVTTIVATTTTKTNIILFPVEEAVNVVLNYNGDDDIDSDKDEKVYDPTTNSKISIFNPSANTFYNNSKRALDVYINGLLNNTISVDTLTNSKTDPDSPPYITYMDASMNYMTTNGNQIIVGDESSSAVVDGTISNAEFIKDGCSPQNARDIFNQGESGSILENLLSYKLRFSFIEDDKETKMYDFP